MTGRVMQRTRISQDINQEANITDGQALIITQLLGGLGNQMFQYAAGRALALRNETALALDISGFESYGLHQGFELQRVFRGPFEVASDSDIRKVLGWQSPAGIRRILARRPFARLFRTRLTVEPHFQYWPGIQSLPRDSYLSGYWQSERYFADAATQIRADFTFRLPLDKENAVLAEQIKQQDSVSLHVRRGDYASNPKTSATHGLCSLEYYQAAIRHVAERVPQPRFYIFSDDIAWVRANLKIKLPCVHVQHNRRAESYNDMRLMSLCRHHIIANSSFSWWGAWLDQGTDKIVVAPQQWFARQTDVRDLFPAGWVTL
jgi:hypothetical protein